MSKDGLGAIELIELGQTAVPPDGGRPLVVLSPSEAALVVRTAEAIISFAEEYPIEFYAFCPHDRWQNVLKKIGSGITFIEKQTGRSEVLVPADTLTALLDLEECTSGTRDARLRSSKYAILLSAGSALAGSLLGLSWLSTPGYIASLAILFGTPVLQALKAEPAEPHKVTIGLGDHTSKDKILERVVLPEAAAPFRHHWGTAEPRPGSVEQAVCIGKDFFRVRIEGWWNDFVSPAPGWSRMPLVECAGKAAIAVWHPGERSSSSYGPVPESSGHEKTLWIEYEGPNTAGIKRRAGPFG